MVFVNVKAGQLANRLIHFSNFIVNAVEYDYRLVYPWFQEYFSFFEAAAIKSLNQYGIRIRITPFPNLDKFILLILRVIKFPFLNSFFRIPCIAIHSTQELDKKEMKYDLNDKEFIATARKKMLFVNGWGYRDPENFDKYAPLIRSFFIPNKTLSDEVDRLIDLCKSKGDTIIGVHIRKGDYKSFKEGKYYYSEEVYAEKMKSLQNLLKTSNKNCVFLLCSNEPVTTSPFTGLSIVAQQRHAVVDLYALAKCNYIIGPPSTYTIWSSFFGNVPLFMMNSAESQIFLHGFRVMKQF